MQTDAMNITRSRSWLPNFPEKDDRIEGWLLLGDPLPVLSLLAAYVTVVKVLGPGMMASRKPLELRPIILIYNAAMVIANLFMTTFTGYHAFVTGHLNPWLTGPDFRDHPTTVLLLKLSWYYLLLRLAECIETVLFVLRKRFHQVSTLHVFHHVSVTFSVYFYVTFGGFALAGFELVFNAGIHVLMYTYYFLAACGPSVQKYLWWKKYLTKIQIAQFGIMIARNIHLAIWLRSKYSWLPAFMLFQCFVFFLQFSHFYYQSYNKKKGEARRIETNEKVDLNNNNCGDDKKSL